MSSDHLSSCRGAVTRRILWIDDALRSDDSLVRLVSLGGFVVDCASEAATGLALARSTSYHALLLDLELPDAPGIGVLRRLAQEQPNLPIIVVTGFLHLFEDGLLRTLGAAGVLAKPVGDQEILDVLDRLTSGQLRVQAFTAELKGQFEAASDARAGDMHAHLSRIIDLLICAVATPDVDHYAFLKYAAALRLARSIELTDPGNEGSFIP